MSKVSKQSKWPIVWTESETTSDVSDWLEMRADSWTAASTPNTLLASQTFSEQQQDVEMKIVMNSDDEMGRWNTLLASETFSEKQQDEEVDMKIVMNSDEKRLSDVFTKRDRRGA